MWCFCVALFGSVGFIGGSAISAVLLLVPSLVLLKELSRQALATRWLKRLSRDERDVFAFREVTITDEAVETKSAQGAAQTSWADYAYYRRDQDIIWLYLRREGLKRRREQGGSEERQSQFGVDLQKIDIFPRLQFEDEAEWERFQRVVKHKLWGTWAWLV